MITTGHRRRSGWWIVLILAGAVVGGYGVHYAHAVRAFVARSDSGTATVVRHDRVSRVGSRAGSYAYYPVLRFEIRTGEEIRARANLGGKPAPFDVGEIVGIRYDRRHPIDVRIDSLVGLWAVPLIFGGVGIACLALGLGLRIRPGRRA